MADSKRQQIMVAFEAALGTIRKANGYSTDIGVRVFPWRRAPLGINELPCIVVRDTTAKVTYDDAPIGQVNNHLEVDIEALFSGAATASMARNALDDIFRCLGADPRFGGLVLETHIISHELDMQAAEHISGGVNVSALLVYRTPRYTA